jgi:hypothetical protein
MNHQCSREGEIEIAVLSKSVADIEKVLFGNGQPGLDATVIKLTIVVEELVKTTSKIEKLLEKKEDYMIMQRRWMITTILAVAGTLVSMIFG